MALEPLYPNTDAVPLLSASSNKYRNLGSDDERKAQVVLAELLLGLEEPAYADPDIAARLEFAIALQINFQMDQGVVTSQILQTASISPALTKTEGYRDRYLHPGAAAMVDRVTQRATVGFSPMQSGT